MFTTIKVPAAAIGAKFALAREDKRYSISNMLIEVTDERATAVATDGTQMAVCRWVCEDVPDGRLLVPGDLLRQAKALAAEKSATVTVTSTGLEVKNGHQTLRCSAVAYDPARFPPYKLVLPAYSDFDGVTPASHIRVCTRRCAEILTWMHRFMDPDLSSVQIYHRDMREPMRFDATSSSGEQMIGVLASEYAGQEDPAGDDQPQDGPPQDRPITAGEADAFDFA